MARVILIPGWASTSKVWNDVAAALPAEFAVERIDWRDALDNDPPAQDAIIAGWSLGSLCALRMAARGNARGVVVLAGMARFVAEGDAPGVPAAALRAMRAQLGRDREACLRGFFEAALAPGRDDGARAALLEEARGLPDDALARGLEFLARADLRADLARIAVPVEILHGEGDAIVPPACGRYLAAHTRRARFTSLPGAGHALPLAAPGETARAIGRCVRAVRGLS
ncbi:MAG TPA: alpha/beta hydrolase [Planctomycetes bacterium]|nr:alpha/beta hydrolase [Planctomycetota bacterium]